MGFYVAKILGAFVVPPGLYLTLIAGLLVWIHWTRRRDETDAPPGLAGVAAVLWVLFALVYLTSISPTRRLLAAPLEHAHPPIPAGARPDAIVVLGAGVIPRSPECPAGTSLTQTTLKRLMYARGLSLRLGVPVILSGGDPFDRSDTTEGDAMRSELLGLSVEPTRIVVEGRSANTLQNARFVRDIARARGLARLALVTSALHMPRAVATFRSAGLDVIPAPTDYTSLTSPTTLADFLPAGGNLNLVEVAVREYVGLAYYRLAHRVR